MISVVYGLYYRVADDGLCFMYLKLKSDFPITLIFSYLTGDG